MVLQLLGSPSGSPRINAKIRHRSDWKGLAADTRIAPPNFALSCELKVRE